MVAHALGVCWPRHFFSRNQPSGVGGVEVPVIGNGWFMVHEPFCTAGNQKLLVEGKSLAVNMIRDLWLFQLS